MEASTSIGVEIAAQLGPDGYAGLPNRLVLALVRLAVGKLPGPYFFEDYPRTAPQLKQFEARRRRAACVWRVTCSL